MSLARNRNLSMCARNKNPIFKISRAWQKKTQQMLGKKTFSDIRPRGRRIIAIVNKETWNREANSKCENFFVQLFFSRLTFVPFTGIAVKWHSSCVYFDEDSSLSVSDYLDCYPGLLGLFTKRRDIEKGIPSAKLLFRFGVRCRRRFMSGAQI